MKLAACSDIHIGRIPAIPKAMELHSHTAWNAVVEKAIALQVNVLILAGDVVEQDNALFEAYGALIRGLKKLETAGIKVIGVAGNHDAGVFPRIAKDCPSVTMLGLGGSWDHLDYQGVRFIGWSFPDSQYSKNPLSNFPKELTQYHGPVFGILHANVDSGQNYAPVRSSELTASGIPLWALGHIHKGSLLEGGHAFYCGSPYALDAGELGQHGIWTVETVGDNIWSTPEFRPISPWVFEECMVNITAEPADQPAAEHSFPTDQQQANQLKQESQQKEMITSALTKALRERGEQYPHYPELQDMYCRITLTGSLAGSVDLQKLLTFEQLQELEVPAHRITVHALGKFQDATQLAVDLESLAKGVGLQALLAKELLAPDTIKELLLELAKLETDSRSHKTFNLLDSTVMQAPDQHALLKQAGTRLLQAILSQETAL